MTESEASCSCSALAEKNGTFTSDSMQPRTSALNFLIIFDNWKGRSWMEVAPHSFVVFFILSGVEPRLTSRVHVWKLWKRLQDFSFSYYLGKEAWCGLPYSEGTPDESRLLGRYSIRRSSLSRGDLLTWIELLQVRTAYNAECLLEHRDEDWLNSRWKLKYNLAFQNRTLVSPTCRSQPPLRDPIPMDIKAFWLRRDFSSESVKSWRCDPAQNTQLCFRNRRIKFPIILIDLFIPK